jgi:LysR family glycine cleavage system transcriptional activator
LPVAATGKLAATRRLPLGSLRVFVAVAQHLSFTRAADTLGVTTSAASLQIRALEEYLRRPLFRRSGRQISLTDEGAALLPRVQRALEELERAVDDTRGNRGGGTLRVTTIVSFLQQWLLPRLPRFYVQHPGIDLHVHTSTELVDFLRAECDAAIRFGLGRWPNLLAVKLFDEWLVPVCAPALLAKHGPVNDADDLRRYRLLHSTTEPWTAWLLRDHAGNDDPLVVRGSHFDDSVSIVRSAVAGHGLALVRWSLAASEIASGALVAASAKPVKGERSYWFVYPARSRIHEPVVALRDWLLAESAQFAPPPATDRSKG